MFYINPGELRTKIRIQRPVKVGKGSFAKIIWPDLGSTLETDPPKYIYAKWQALKGAEKWIANSLQAVGTGTVTIRYNPAVTEPCRIVRDGINYQIVDIGDPTQRKQWLQITVKAAVNGG
jgi:SPP1 family predicted phage head-tail adaptor